MRELTGHKVNLINDRLKVTAVDALALTKMEEAKFWLQERTRDRMARGVEGTSQK